MFNINNFLRQCLLALALAGSTLTAMAAPTSFHVDVDSTSLAGDGWLDFFFSSSLAALPATATLSNFSGAFGAVDAGYSGDYTVGPAGSFALENGAGFNYLSRIAGLGGMLGFDVSFSGPFFDAASGEGSVFSVALYDQDGMVVGNENGVAVFDLLASSPAVGVAADADFAAVTPIEAVAVPEPAGWLLMLTGLALAGCAARRKQ